MRGIKTKTLTASECSLLYGLTREKPIRGHKPHRTPHVPAPQKVTGKQVVINYTKMIDHITRTQAYQCDAVQTIKDPDGAPRAMLLYSKGTIFATLTPSQYWKLATDGITMLDERAQVVMDIPKEEVKPSTRAINKARKNAKKNGQINLFARGEVERVKRERKGTQDAIKTDEPQATAPQTTAPQTSTSKNAKATQLMLQF